jgi:Ca2+-binding RTX toxin-like protein
MVGKITSEGDRAMRSTLARRLFHLDGSGIKIGIISDSFNALKGKAADIAKGDLPGRSNPNGFTKPVRVLKDTKIGFDEGRAMTQIIHDVAPGAELLFYRAGDTEREFATGIKALAKAGANIIVDDVFFSSETLLQDGVSAQAVDDVTRRGVLYFSAAGNDGSASYQSQFRPGPTFTYRGSTYETQDFDSGEAVNPFQAIQASRNAKIDLMLNWDQPSGQVSTDMEMFLLDRPLLPGAGSTVLQDITLSPAANSAAKELEYSATSPRTVYLAIAKRVTPTSPTPSLIKWVSVANGGDGNTLYQFVNDSSNVVGEATVYGHANAATAIAVGAAYARDTPAFGVNPALLEDYSSRGSSPILFNAQGDRLPMPQIRQKPEIIGPDGVGTTVLGFDSFFGTSAAAPHAAAVAALMLQRSQKHLTSPQILAALQNTASPVVATNNLKSAAGFVRADSAVLDSATAELTGTSGANRLRGRKGSDNLFGLAGNDRLRGGNGLDALFGGGGNDSIEGDQGNDYLLGEAGNDRLSGGKGSDTLLGDRGKDRLAGDQGNDFLDGGSGKNQLRGGEGQDAFALHQNGLAIVLDFNPSEDKLVLSGKLKFKRLDILQQGSSTLITFAGNGLVKLNGVRANTVTAASFTSHPFRV